MQIDLPIADEQRLAQHAAEAGYSDVATFVAARLAAVAHQPVNAELAPLSDAALQASLAACDESMAQIDCGEELSIDDARRRTLNQLWQSR